MLNTVRYAAASLAGSVLIGASTLPGATTPAELDRCVAAHVALSKQTLPAVCDDAVFQRRVYLDLTGLLPEPDVARRFLDDGSPDKRRALIEALLASPAHADYQTLRWLDLLRVKSEFPANLWPNAVQAYARLIRENVGTNQTYAAFARELLTSSGSNFRDPAVNFFRALPQKDAPHIAAFVAQSLLGIRYDTLPAEAQRDLALVFSGVDYKATTEWKEEIVFFNPAKVDPALRALRFPDGKRARCVPGADPRPLFAAWLTAPDNPYFARCMANRIWFHLMGRGIVHEADDLHPGNPPANPALLELLETAFRESRYDLHALYRLILNSKTYQAESAAPPDALAARIGYAYYQTRQLDAEVLLDILCQITGTTESYSSQIPEPYTSFTESHAVRIGDGSVTSPFLELFGRPPRDTGLLSERANGPSTAQRLHLLNASHIQDKLRRPPLFGEFRRNRERHGPTAQPLEELYLLTLSRLPTPEERRTVMLYTQACGGPGHEVAQDVLWALVNTKEFCVRR